MKWKKPPQMTLIRNWVAWHKEHLTCKALNIFVADNILIMPTIHMKCQVLFCLKNRKKMWKKIYAKFQSKLAEIIYNQRNKTILNVDIYYWVNILKCVCCSCD